MNVTLAFSIPLCKVHAIHSLESASESINLIVLLINRTVPVGSSIGFDQDWINGVKQLRDYINNNTSRYEIYLSSFLMLKSRNLRNKIENFFNSLNFFIYTFLSHLYVFITSGIRTFNFYDFKRANITN